MFQYKIIFTNGDPYISTSVFPDRQECAMAAADFCRRYRAHTNTTCTYRICSAI